MTDSHNPALEAFILKSGQTLGYLYFFLSAAELQDGFGSQINGLTGKLPNKARGSRDVAGISPRDVESGENKM